jgi:hypothetical protein
MAGFVEVSSMSKTNWFGLIIAVPPILGSAKSTLLITEEEARPSPLRGKASSAQRPIRLALICIALLGWSRGVEAGQPPSALVEAITGIVAGAELLDYVSPGQVIQLGNSGIVVLSYLDSCLRETITGGEVTVGMRSSQVKGGKVNREKPQCSSGEVSDSRSLGSAGAVFRGRPKDRRLAESKRTTIYSLSPLFEINDYGTMIIRRIDQPGERYEIIVSPNSLIKARFYDFAAANGRLIAGGRYEVSLGESRLVIEVDESANADGPLLSPLVRLLPSKTESR